MNIAFGALVILLILFPGIAFRISYLNGPYSRRNIFSSLVDELFFSLAPAFAFQVAGYLVMEHLLRIDVQAEQLYKLISGPSSAYKEELNYAQVEHGMVLFFAYTGITTLVAILSGKLARYFIRRFNWDIRFHYLRFNNDWYYLFSGRILDFPDIEGQSVDIELIRVDVLMETKEGTFIYSGILHDFYLQRDSIDRIYLKEVYRRKLADDNDPEVPSLTDESSFEMAFDKRYYRMPGDLFVVPYSSIKNLNVTYYTIATQDDNSEFEAGTLS